jgi:hypothetical protein
MLSLMRGLRASDRSGDLCEVASRVSMTSMMVL